MFLMGQQAQDTIHTRVWSQTMEGSLTRCPLFFDQEIGFQPMLLGLIYLDFYLGFVTGFDVILYQTLVYFSWGSDLVIDQEGFAIHKQSSYILKAVFDELIKFTQLQILPPLISYLFSLLFSFSSPFLLLLSFFLSPLLILLDLFCTASVLQRSLPFLKSGNNELLKVVKHPLEENNNIWLLYS